jgi:hypothetical protein
MPISELYASLNLIYTKAGICFDDGLSYKQRYILLLVSNTFGILSGGIFH